MDGYRLHGLLEQLRLPLCMPHDRCLPRRGRHPYRLRARYRRGHVHMVLLALPGPPGLRTRGAGPAAHHAAHRLRHQAAPIVDRARGLVFGEHLVEPERRHQVFKVAGHRLRDVFDEALPHRPRRQAIVPGTGDARGRTARRIFGGLVLVGRRLVHLALEGLPMDVHAPRGVQGLLLLQGLRLPRLHRKAELAREAHQGHRAHVRTSDPFVGGIVGRQPRGALRVERQRLAGR
mmetsp:Transcript_124123/g.356497  ORF Transcript_124123/g.356497 Transcript_124123/m.356497 type:complete len:233 (-) Transcript_124123:359-1057(-)